MSAVADSTRLLMCYGTPISPGRYLCDALRRIGVQVERFDGRIDFREVDLSQYAAVVFVERGRQKTVSVEHIEDAKIPKLFWVHHGANHLDFNLACCAAFRPDVVLMAHSLHLAARFPVPVRFFPFAVATDIFNCTKPLHERRFDIAFVGSRSDSVYPGRTHSLRAIHARFGQSAKLSLQAQVYVEQLARLYGDAKIVFNQAADRLRTINMRLFEGVGCGALVLTDRVPDQDQLLRDGEHVVVFKNRRDLLAKLEHYLGHLDEAQSIASTGYRHAMAHHTYEHRARELLDCIAAIGGGGSAPPSTPTDAR